MLVGAGEDRGQCQCAKVEVAVVGGPLCEHQYQKRPVAEDLQQRGRHITRSAGRAGDVAGHGHKYIGDQKATNGTPCRGL